MDKLIIVAIITGAFGLAGIALQIFLGERRTRQLKEIHVLVNSRLTLALNELAKARQINARIGYEERADLIALAEVGVSAAGKHKAED